MAKKSDGRTAKLDSRRVKDEPAPKAGNRIYYDSEVAGFGLRVTSAGARSFILNYRTRSGRERRFTIGPVTEWNVIAARNEAKELKKKIERGDDPLAAIRADREAPTVADMCTRFTEEHLPKKRASTRQGYGIIIDRHILPKMKHFKVVEVTFADVDSMHRRITKEGSPYEANRAIAVLSKMFNLAISWQWAAANPCKGIERNQETKRDRYLSTDELARLGEALAGYADQQGANIIRLLLLTGARSGEVKAMRWDQLDLKTGVWAKPGATTKQKTMHRVPLSAPARQLLDGLQADADDEAEFVFPGRSGGHRMEFRKAWRALCKTAKIKNARPHDMRHTYASVLASTGKSLPIIGRLLGHTQAQTTQRYAHLQDDPLREATESAGAIVTAGSKAGAEIVPIKGGRR